jgi:polysaccharide biosynthesis transport protein
MDSKEHLIEEVDIQRYWLVFKRRWLPASGVFAASLGLAMFSALSQEPLFDAGGKILLQPDRASSLTGLPQELGELKSLTIQRDPRDTQEAIITSGPVLEDAIRTLNIRGDEGELVTPAELAAGLTVTPIEGTDVLQVNYKSAQPELSAAVVNQVMQSYIEANIQSNRSEVKAARKYLERELPKAEAEVKKLTQALQRFNEQNRIVSLPQEAASTVEAIALLDRQISETQAQLVHSESRTSQLRQRLGMPLDQALILSKLTDSDSVQTAYGEWQTIQADLAAKRTRYTDQHPEVRALVRQEAALRDILEARVYEAAGSDIPLSGGVLQLSPVQQSLAEDLVQAEIESVSVNNQLATLAATRDAYVEWADVFPSLEATQLELQQRLNYARDSYETLLKRLQEIRLAENQSVGSARVVEPAHVPSSAEVSGQMTYLMLGSVVGIFLGIATAFLLDLIDRSIKTVKDGEKVLGYVLLGVIPRFELPREAEWQEMQLGLDGLPSPRIVTLQSGHPLISASYQMLQANLRFISSDKKLQAIVITSSIAGEGKSEVCANLAASIAQTDRRVLLIDADMRSPDQHHLWNVMNGTGLSHVLVGEGDIERAIQPIRENLSLLTAGVQPPNPLALIDSERMASLITTFRKQYDYIIIDAPSLAGAADAAVLGNLTDGVLMTMRPRVVSYDNAIAAKALLNRSGAKVLGFVANAVDMRVDSSEYIISPPVSERIELEEDVIPTRELVAAHAIDSDPWE